MAVVVGLVAGDVPQEQSECLLESVLPAILGLVGASWLLWSSNETGLLMASIPRSEVFVDVKASLGNHAAMAATTIQKNPGRATERLTL